MMSIQKKLLQGNCLIARIFYVKFWFRTCSGVRLNGLSCYHLGHLTWKPTKKVSNMLNYWNKNKPLRSDHLASKHDTTYDHTFNTILESTKSGTDMKHKTIPPALYQESLCSYIRNTSTSMSSMVLSTNKLKQIIKVWVEITRIPLSHTSL